MLITFIKYITLILFLILTNERNGKRADLTIDVDDKDRLSFNVTLFDTSNGLSSKIEIMRLPSRNYSLANFINWINLILEI